MVVSDSKTLSDFIDVLSSLEKEDIRAITTFLNDILSGDTFLERRDEKLQKELNEYKKRFGELTSDSDEKLEERKDRSTLDNILDVLGDDDES